MRRWVVRFAGLVLLVPLLTGCWDVQSEHLLRLPTMFGVDWSHGQYQLTVQSVAPNLVTTSSVGSGSSSSVPPLWIGVGKGRTFTDALLQSGIEDPLHTPLMTAHVSLLVLGKSALRPQALNGLWDALLRNVNFYPSCYVVVSRGTSAAVMRAPDVLAPTPTDAFRRAMEHASYADRLAPVAFWEVIERVYDEPYEGIVIPVVKVVSGPSPDRGTIFHFAGGAVLFENKLVGWLTPNQMQTWTILTNHSNTGALTVQQGAERVVVAINRTHTWLRWRDRHIYVRTNAQISVIEVNTAQGLADGAVPPAAATLAAHKLDADIAQLIAWSQAHKVDILQLGHQVAQFNRSQFPHDALAWPAIFAKSQVLVTVKVNIANNGRLT